MRSAFLIGLIVVASAFAQPPVPPAKPGPSLTDKVLKDKAIGYVERGKFVAVLPVKATKFPLKLFSTRMQEATAPKPLDLSKYEGQGVVIGWQPGTGGWGAHVVERVPIATIVQMIQTQELLDALRRK